MPKKSSSKTQAPTPKDPIVEQEKPTCTPKKTSHEIDDIFSSKKRKKPEPQKVENQTEDVAIKSSKTKKKKRKSKDPKENGFVDPPSRPRNKTGDGLAIYSEEELGIAKADAGGTPLCPFDCSCCF